MRARTAAVVAASVLVLSGCGEGGPLTGGGSGSGTDREPKATSTAQCGEPGASLEGCFDRDEMGDYLNEIAPLVTKFFQSQYRNLPEVDNIVYVESGQRGREACVDGSGRQALATDQSYEYCPADATIYIGQDLLWQFYDTLGDAAPAVGLAHEYTHHVQTVARIPSPRSAEESVAFENQADCGAGAFMKWADEEGIAEYPDDLEDVAGLLENIGSAEGPDRDHGTSEERIRSFELGLGGGLEACNDFTSTPLIS